jgi:hypothetical protein
MRDKHIFHHLKLSLSVNVSMGSKVLKSSADMVEEQRRQIEALTKRSIAQVSFHAVL